MLIATGKRLVQVAGIAVAVTILVGCVGSSSTTDVEKSPQNSAIETTDPSTTTAAVERPAEAGPETRTPPEVRTFYSSERAAYSAANAGMFASALKSAISPTFYYKDFDTITRSPADKLHAVKVELSDIAKVKDASVVVRRIKDYGDHLMAIIDRSFNATRTGPGSNGSQDYSIIGTSEDTWRKLGASWKLDRSVWLSHKFTLAGVRRQLGTDGAVDFRKVYK